MNFSRIALLALFLIQCSPCRGDVTFSAMGCGPYSPASEEAVSFYLRTEGEIGKSAFIVHCGDIVTGKIKTWPEKQFAHVAEILSQSPIPIFIVPGDNEWNDQLDPDSSWQYWQKHFLEFEGKWKQPDGASVVSHQQVRPENFAFTLDNVLFIGVNKVGGTIHDPKEWTLRLKQNVDWLSRQFKTHGETTHATVIFAQASAIGGDKSFAEALGRVGDQYGKPILYIHADGHKWIVEPAKWGQHVTRLQLDVVNEKFPPLQVTATSDPENPFILNRRLDDELMKYTATESCWTMAAGGDGNDKIRGMATGTDGSIFVTGEISPNTNFGGHQMKSGGLLDFVVAKLNSKGHVVWASSAGGEKVDRGYGVSPTKDGGCYVTGHFESESIQFGDFTLKNSGNYDGFVARYDGAGVCLWAKRFGGPDYDYGHGVATAPDGTAVLAGSVANLGGIAGVKIGIEKGRSAVLAKVSMEGDLEWVKTASGPSTSGHNVAVGVDGMIYLCGYARGKVVWSNSITTESKVQDACVAKYHSNGELQWVRTAGGASDGLATSVAVDTKTGNLLIAGMFKGVAVFGEQQFTSKGKHDFYAATLSPDGVFQHAHQGGGVSTDYALGATSLPDGGFAITGEITESGEFDGATHHCAGARDAYIATIGGDGRKVKSFRLMGGKDNDLSYAVAALKDGSIVVSGAFRNVTKLGSIELKAQKGSDIFIGKFIP